MPILLVNPVYFAKIVSIFYLFKNIFHSHLMNKRTVMNISWIRWLRPVLLFRQNNIEQTHCNSCRNVVKYTHGNRRKN